MATGKPRGDFIPTHSRLANPRWAGLKGAALSANPGVGGDSAGALWLFAFVLLLRTGTSPEKVVPSSFLTGLVVLAGGLGQAGFAHQCEDDDDSDERNGLDQ